MKMEDGFYWVKVKNAKFPFLSEGDEIVIELLDNDCYLTGVGQDNEVYGSDYDFGENPKPIKPQQNGNDQLQQTISQQQEVIDECKALLERFKPYSIYDEFNHEIYLGGTFEYNDGSEHLGEEVNTLLSKLNGSEE